MARHQRMPTLEAGYKYAVVPCLPDQFACNKEESIYGYRKRTIFSSAYTSRPFLQQSFALWRLKGTLLVNTEIQKLIQLLISNERIMCVEMFASRQRPPGHKPSLKTSFTQQGCSFRGFHQVMLKDPATKDLTAGRLEHDV